MSCDLMRSVALVKRCVERVVSIRKVILRIAVDVVLFVVADRAVLLNVVAGAVVCFVRSRFWTATAGPRMAARLISRDTHKTAVLVGLRVLR